MVNRFRSPPRLGSIRLDSTRLDPILQSKGTGDHVYSVTAWKDKSVRGEF